MIDSIIDKLIFFIPVLTSAIAFMIFNNTHKMYIISKYEGLKIFSLAFLLFGIENFSRFFLYYMIPKLSILSSNLYNTIKLVSYISLISSLLYLSYSLTWKNFSTKKKDVSFKIILLFIVSILVAIIGLFNSFILYFIAFCIFSYTLFLLYNKYIMLKLQKNERKYIKLYFFVLVLTFLSYISNIVFRFIPYLRWYVNSVIFFVFIILYAGTVKTTFKNS